MYLLPTKRQKRDPHFFRFLQDIIGKMEIFLKKSCSIASFRCSMTQKSSSFCLNIANKNLTLTLTKKNFFFLVTTRDRKFHLYIDQSQTKIPYYERVRICRKMLLFFSFFFQRKFRKCDISTECKHTKTNKNMIFFVLFHKFS